MNPQDQIKEEIKGYLKKNSMTQKEFANVMGLSPISLSRMMRGERPFTQKNINTVHFLIQTSVHKPACPFEKCPATHPVDHFLTEILEDWNFLGETEKANLAGLAAEYVKGKKERTNSVCVSKNRIA